jgi:hypothetical protein
LPPFILRKTHTRCVVTACGRSKPTSFTDHGLSSSGRKGTQLQNQLNEGEAKGKHPVKGHVLLSLHVILQTMTIAQDVDRDRHQQLVL